MALPSGADPRTGTHKVDSCLSPGVLSPPRPGVCSCLGFWSGLFPRLGVFPLVSGRWFSCPAPACSRLFFFLLLAAGSSRRKGRRVRLFFLTG